MKWAEVIAKPEFKELDASDQAYVRQSWWDHFVGPDLKANGIPEEEIQAVRRESITSFDNGQGYVSSFASSVGRGIAGTASGVIGGLGAITDSPALTETADSMDAAVADALPVNPSMKYTNLAGQAVGQAGSMLATGGVTGMAGKALGGVRAGTMAAQTAVLGTGGIAEARDAAREADFYGMTGAERAVKIASGVLTGTLTEAIPFGMGAELRGVNTLLNAGERVVGKRAGSAIGDIASEPVEEVIGQMGNNVATQVLAPQGTETPGIMSGTGDAAFGGLIGGATFAGFNAAAGANGEQQPAPLPPPAGFTEPAPAAPVAPGVPGRASVVNPVQLAPVAAPLSDAELSAMEQDSRVPIVAAAIATAPDAATEAAIVETAAVAARIDAISKEAPVLEQAAPVIQNPAAVEIPVEPTPLEPLPANEPISQTPPQQGDQIPQETPGILPVRPVPEGPLPQTPQAAVEIPAAEAAAMPPTGQPVIPTPEPIAEYQAPDQDPYSRSDAIVPPPANPLPPEAVAARIQVKTSLPGIAAIVTDPALPWEGRLTTDGRIELNTARLATEEDVDRVFDHELAHLAERDSMAPDIAAMRAAMPQDFLAALQEDIRRRGYERSAIPSEVVANLAQQLNAQFQQAPVWRQFVQRVKTWAKQKIGLALNDSDAEVLAARIIARGLQMASAGRARSGEALSLPSPSTPGMETPPPPAAPKRRPIYELIFGNDKRIVAETKDFEGRNAGRAALSTLLFDGIVPNYKPGAPFEEIIGTLTPEQRNALHDRVLENLFRMTGTAEDAAAYGRELKTYLETVPELAGQRNISMAGLQYSNLVQVAGILSGVYGQTAAFSTIIHTDNDQIKIGLDTDTILRSDLGRLLGSQSGIGARLAEFAAIIAKYNNAGLERLGLTAAQINILSESIANKQLTANEVEALYAESTTSPKNADLINSAIAKLERLADAAAATASTAAGKKTVKPERMAKSILSDAVGPLVAKLPVNKIVKAFMAAPAHHRNSAAWREMQITNWLTGQGIDNDLASRLSVSMDEMVAAVMANVIYQQQERFITNKKGIGDAAIANSEFRQKFEQNPDAVREAIRAGLLNDGAPWQAWFSSVTGIAPLSPQVITEIGKLESIISGEQYLTPEKGVASAKLRDLMDRHFGKDPSLWEVLAASYDASALSSGTTMGIQVSGPLGRLIGTFGTDLIAAVGSGSPRKAGDIIDSLIASIDVYAAELPLAWKYDTAGTTMGNADLELAKVAALRKDLQKYGAILLNKNASAAARVAVIPRVIIASQDFLRQAMNAADSAALAGFTRYFETREVRRILRRKGITKAQVQSEMDRMGFFRDRLELLADSLGYDGALKRRFIQDAMWEQEKSVSKARNDDPAAHAAHMKELAANSKDEAENQIFIGEKRDSPGVTDPVDWVLSGLQQIGQAAFRNARERVESGQAANGSLQRIATRALFGFVGIPLNAARASIWYSPLAIISWANYLGRKALYPGGNPYARSLGNEIAVRQRIKEGLVGNTILLLGAALVQGLGDDEDKWQVNGYGPDPSRYPDEAKAWQRRHTAFAIERIGKDGKTETFKFDKGPLEYLKAPLMLLGGSNDARLNSKLDKEPEPATKDLVMGGIRQLGLSSLTTGMRNVAGFREGLQQMGQERSFDRAGSTAGFMVSPIMPYSGAERWIRTWNNPELLERTFKNNLPFAHYRDDARPALNLFGQNLRPDPSPTEAFSRQTNGLLPGYSRNLTEDDNRLHGWIERTGIQPATPARSSLESKLGQPISDAQWWEYTKAAGKVRYDETLAAIDGTRMIERTIPARGKDIKRMGPMKKGLADLDLSNGEAVKQATAILKDISAEAHQAGLEAIGLREPEKEKAPKKKAAPIY